MTSFVSVATGAARYQDISMNPQKLAGQCAKLKCCINYEVDAYVEAHKHLPSREVVLETKDNSYYHFKVDIFKREITYSTDKSLAANLVTIPATRAFEVINMNKRGVKPVALTDNEKVETPKREVNDLLGQDSVTRFDNLKKKKKKRGGGGEAKAAKAENANAAATPKEGNAPKESNANAANAPAKEGNAAPHKAEAAPPKEGNANAANAANAKPNRRTDNNRGNRPRPNKPTNTHENKPRQGNRPPKKPADKPVDKPADKPQA